MDLALPCSCDSANTHDKQLGQVKCTPSNLAMEDSVSQTQWIALGPILAHFNIHRISTRWAKRHSTSKIPLQPGLVTHT